jgi:hypothetical protein
LPARSFTPFVSPLIVAVYVTEFAKGFVGASVAVHVAALEVTVAGTRAFDASLSSMLFVLIVAGSIASLKVTVTFVAVLTPVDPLVGVAALTTGGVASMV